LKPTQHAQGAKEGVHHNERTIGGIELHHHCFGVLKFFSFSPNLIIQLILEVWAFQIKFQMNKFGGSNLNLLSSHHFTFEAKSCDTRRKKFTNKLQPK
jgi:hypothetical protein